MGTCIFGNFFPLNVWVEDRYWLFCVLVCHNSLCLQVEHTAVNGGDAEVKYPICRGCLGLKPAVSHGLFAPEVRRRFAQ